MEKQKQGFFSKLLNGDTGQNDLIKKAQELQEEMDGLVEARKVAEKTGTQAEVDNYARAINTKLKAFKDSLAEEQDAIKDAHIAARKNLADRLASSSVPVPEASITAAEDAMEKSFNETYKERQHILNGLVPAHVQLLRRTERAGKEQRPNAREGQYVAHRST